MSNYLFLVQQSKKKRRMRNKESRRAEIKIGVKPEGVDKGRQDICAMGLLPDCLTKERE